MIKQLPAVRPITKEFDVPEWYHAHGSKICVCNCDTRNRVLSLASKAAEVKIHPHMSQGWELEYLIRQSDGSVTEGKVWLCTHDLKAAFRISDECYEMWGASVIREYGGDVAHEDKYIRYHKYLNIPHPGTGEDGDSNISIYVDDPIKAAVERLLLAE